MQISYNNHVKYYVDDVLYGSSTDPDRKFRVEVGKVDHDRYNNSNFEQEACRVATLQDSIFGKDLLVFLSGGLDSEISVRSYLKAGIKPKCIIMRYTNFLNPGTIENSIEVGAAVQTAEQLGVEYEFFDFDVLRFYLSGEAKEMAIKYTCYLFPILVYYKVATMMKSRPCIFCGEILLEKYKSVWYYRFNETLEAATYRVSRDHGIPIVMEWFAYTPELMLYFLKSPIITKLVSGKSRIAATTPIKNVVLRSLAPDVRDSKKEKTWGYQTMTNMVVEANWHFTSLMPFRKDVLDYGTQYTEIIKMLEG